MLGSCFLNGNGCECSIDKAKKYFLAASELGLVDRMLVLGRVSGETDPQRWLWWRRAAEKGYPFCFLDQFFCVPFTHESGCASCVFQIGRALNRHVELAK